MKIFIYSVCIAGILLLVRPNGSSGRASFIPPGKPSLSGHIQSLKSATYQIVTDNGGNIIKGSPLLNTKESLTYDEYGKEMEDDRYDTGEIPVSKKTLRYYPNGAIMEIKDSERYTRTDKVRANSECVKFITRTYTYAMIVIQKYNYRYDTRGNLLCAAESTYYNKGKSPASGVMTNYFYNSSGKMLQEFTFNNSDTVNATASTMFRYNEIGQLTETDKSERILRSGEGIGLFPTVKTVFEYDKKGRVIDSATYQFKIGLVQDKKIKFDNSGDTLETVETDYTGKDNDNSISKREIRQFIKQTNTLQEDVYDAAGRLTDYTISHLDGQKHLLDMGQFHITYYNTGTVDTLMTNRLVNDEHFNMIEEDKYSGGGKPDYKGTYQYKYDSVGNWVEWVYLTNGKPVQITKREIHYFPDNR